MKKKLAILVASVMVFSSLSPVYGAGNSVESIEIEDVLTDESVTEPVLEEDESVEETVTSDDFSLTEQFKNAHPLQENQETSVDFREDQDYTVMFSFVPQRDGKYMLEDDLDTYLNISVYDEASEEVWPIFFVYTLKKGKTYYIKVEAEETMTGKISIKRKPEVASIDIISEPSRKVLYRGIDILCSSRSGFVGLPGLVLQAIYEDGIVDITDAFVGDGQDIPDAYTQHYVDMYTFKLNGVSGNTVPAEGTYSVTISLENQKIIVDDVVIKDCRELPASISNKGSCPAIVASDQCGWIRLKTGKASKYQLNNSIGNEMFVYSAETLHSVHPVSSWFDFEELERVESGKTVLLNPQTEYFVRVSRFHGDDYVWDMLPEITVTAKPLEEMNLSSCSITIPAATYTGKPVSPAITVKYGSKKLTKNKDYTVSYKNNAKCGTATAIIKGKGSYKGTVKKSFQIIPATPTEFTVKKFGDYLKLQWKKTGGANGYEIHQYKGGTWKKIKTTTGAIYTDKTVKRGATYKYKVRAYATVNGKKIYGKFTSVKSYKF
ncbi:MAG: hypothetical protein Q4F24_10170 [Eubacteriales bacterium]|nr:hypothetical protein [Eubacteriales bacterium]